MNGPPRLALLADGEAGWRAALSAAGIPVVAGEDQLAAAVAAGHDVLVELTAESLLAELSAGPGTVHVVVPQRYDPVRAQLRQLLLRGVIGEVHAAYARWPAPADTAQLDLLAWWLHADPLRVTAESTPGGDQVALVRWSSGVVASCRFDSAAPSDSTAIAINGSRGRIEVERGGSSSRAGITVRPRIGAAYRIVPDDAARPIPDQVLASWLTGRPDALGRLPTLADAARAPAIMRAMRVSAASGHTVDVTGLADVSASSTRGAPARARRPLGGADVSHRVRLPR